MRFAALVALLFSGCGSLSLRPVQPNHALRKLEVTMRLGVPSLDTELAADRTECDALDGKVTSWTAVSIASGVLSGGGGLTTLLTDDTVSRYVIGGVGIGLAVLTAVSSYLTTAYAQRFTRRCTVNVGGR